MPWGLSEEELRAIRAPTIIAEKSQVRQATLRHVYEEGEKPCQEHTSSIGWAKRKCDKCWAELKAGL